MSISRIYAKNKAEGVSAGCFFFIPFKPLKKYIPLAKPNSEASDFTFSQTLVLPWRTEGLSAEAIYATGIFLLQQLIARTST